MAAKTSYMRLINGFNKKLDAMPGWLSPQAGWLYMRLLSFLNKGGDGSRWPAGMLMSDNLLSQGTGLRRQSLAEYREELKTAGLIGYEVRGKGQTATVLYWLKEVENVVIELSKMDNSSVQNGQLNKTELSKMDNSSVQNGQFTPIILYKDLYRPCTIVQMSSAVADDFQKTPQVEVGVKKENQATKNKKKPNEKSKNHARARKADSEEPHSSNAKKTQEPKRPTLLSLAREKFEEFYLQATGENYYWAAKDAANMGQLLKKIRFSREKRGKPLPVDDLSLCDALWQFLTSITTEWVLNNLSVPIINSKFNEIKSEIRNRQNQAKLPTRNGTEPRQPTATRQFASSAERNAAIIQSQRLSICTAMQQTLDGQRDIPGFPNLAPLTDGE